MVDSHSSSPSAGLIDEMKDQVAAKLFSFSCMHVPRACNRAAHELAALGLCCVEGMLLLVVVNCAYIVYDFAICADIVYMILYDH